MLIMAIMVNIHVFVKIFTFPIKETLTSAHRLKIIYHVPFRTPKDLGRFDADGVYVSPCFLLLGYGW